MKDINIMLDPYYNQFERLFSMREEHGIDYKFIRKALKRFMRSYLYDANLICKIRRKLTYSEFLQELKDMRKVKDTDVIPAVEVVKEVQESEDEEQTQNISKEVSVKESTEVASDGDEHDETNGEDES